MGPAAQFELVEFLDGGQSAIEALKERVLEFRSSVLGPEIEAEALLSEVGEGSAEALNTAVFLNAGLAVVADPFEGGPYFGGVINRLAGGEANAGQVGEGRLELGA